MENRASSIEGRMRGAVVIVDDNPDDCFLMNRFLRRGGIENEIVQLGSGHSLLDFARRSGRDVSLVILALSMKLESGLELLRRARQEPGLDRALIVAVGNSSRPEDIQAALDCGANAYYAKGIDLSELSKTVRELEFIR